MRNRLSLEGPRLPSFARFSASLTGECKKALATSFIFMGLDPGRRWTPPLACVQALLST